MSRQATNGLGAEFLDYRIEALVGQGGMGLVYRAFDARLRRTVALKLMAPELALDERFQERFSRESELAMALEHPNVVPIYDAGKVDGRLYLAMRYVDGTDLRARLRSEGVLPPADALSIVRQVAHALDAAHSKGLIHRDVKPSNVLLDGNGHAYLADFGVTRRVAEQGVHFTDGRSLGTPAYLAPEQIEGRPIDGRADVYSLGCMLYECLTGTAPFSSDSRLATVWAHLEEAPPRASDQNRGLPEAIDAVIRQALAKDPDDRYATCAELAAAAEAALGVRDASAASPRRRLLLAGTVMAVATVAALVAVVVSSGGDEPSAAAPAAQRNSVARIDPRTNAIEAVIPVGEAPEATAVVGNTVWVYNWLDDTVSEIDAATNSVAHTTAVSVDPDAVTTLAGPFFAADETGAWIVGDATNGEHLLTHILPAGEGTAEYRLPRSPIAVAVRDGAVWVLTKGAPPTGLLRIDAATGSVTNRIRLDVPYLEGIALTAGAVWVTDADTARLYRVDVHSGDVRRRDLGDVATPPVPGFGSIWMCVADPGSSMIRIEPRTFRARFVTNSVPAEGGRFAAGFGSLWRNDVATGNVVRFDPESGKIVGAIQLSPHSGRSGLGFTPTAVAVGAGSVWITLT